MDLEKYIIGHKAYFYKPPSMNETITRGRRAKHIDHSGIIVRHIGTRSIVIQYQEKEFQRDAGMVMLEKPRFRDADPTIEDRLIIGPQQQVEASTAGNPLQEGEFVIIKDDPNATTWYCAEVRKILVDRIEVNYYTTCTPALGNYQEASITQKEKRLREATFLRTWCLNRGTGLPTTTPPITNHERNEAFMVGKNTTRRHRQARSDTRSRIERHRKTR